MKSKIFTKALIVSFILATATISVNSYAGSRVKPPVANAQLNVSWYQPVLDFFNF